MKHTKIFNHRLRAILTSLGLVCLVLLVAAVPAHADTPGCTLPDGQTGVVVSYAGNSNTTCCPSNATDDLHCLYGKYLNPAIALLAAAVGVTVVIAIIVGAMEYIMSGGDPQKAASGKKRITNALIGLVAFLLLYAFLQFIIPGGLLNG